MAFFSRKPKAKALGESVDNTTHDDHEHAARPVTQSDVDSDATTPVQSGTPSIIGSEKHKSSEPAMDSVISIDGTLHDGHASTEEKADDAIQTNDKVETEEDEEKEEEEIDDTDYPHGMKLVLITLALSLSVFCMALDNTIIATAIPRITDEFHSINDVGWYGS